MIPRFINAQDTVTEFICKWYMHMFTDFAEELDQKYENQLFALKKIRAELFEYIVNDALFICDDYEEITDFLVNDYSIYNIRQKNSKLWEYINEKKVHSNELINTLKKFIEINDNYSW